MKRVIIGCGNVLRGEDAFGPDVVKALQHRTLQQTKLISVLQLCPELVLELLDADEVIFVDASYCAEYHYALACRLDIAQILTLSHHISAHTLIAMLNNLYDVHPKFEIFSMLSDAFETIKNPELYAKAIEKSVAFILYQKAEVLVSNNLH
jgi:hydrogenase maturation protease